MANSNSCKLILAPSIARASAAGRLNMKKWKTIILNFFLLFWGILFLRNIHNLFHAIVYAENLDGDYHLAGSLGYFFLLLLLLFSAIWRFARPAGILLLWAFALAAALYMPAYPWPEHAWKIAHNKERYAALIAREPQNPKFAVLEHEEFPFYFGLSSTWIIYDEGDEIVLPSRLRSDKWRQRVRSHIPVESREPCSLEMSRIKVHYYVLFEQC